MINSYFLHYFFHHIAIASITCSMPSFAVDAPRPTEVSLIPAGCQDLGRFITFKGIDYQQTKDNTQPSLQLSFLVDSFIETAPDAIASASITAGPTNASLFEDPGTGDWESNTDFNTKAEMDAAYPSNTMYLMNTLGGDLGTRNQSFLMGPELYPAVPFLTGTNYSELLAIDPAAEHTIEWSPADLNTTHVLVELYSEDLEDSEVFSAELPPNASSISLPADTLIDDTEYELIIVFFNAPEFFADDCPGFGTGSVGIVGHASSTAIIFTASSSPLCPADLTNDGSLDFFDVSAFLTAFGNGDLVADFSGDGLLDFFDVSAFLTAFGVGCP